VDKCTGRGAKDYCNSYNNTIKTKRLIFMPKDRALNVQSGSVLNIKCTINPYLSEKWEVLP
jgi:hypothetical protein